MSERFYLSCPLSPGPVTLTGPEAHHLAAVCRLRPGDPVCLFNGDGHEYPGRILDVAKKAVTIDLESRRSPNRELGFVLEVAAPVPKGDRGQFLVEKLTELGAARFVPLSTRHSVLEPGAGKLEKLERYVIEASKQCGRNVLMSIAPLTKWDDYCRAADDGLTRIIAHPEGLLLAVESRGTGYRMAIGPEGGFTEDEVQLAIANGWRPVGLGPRILRVETAAISLAAWATSIDGTQGH